MSLLPPAHLGAIKRCELNTKLKSDGRNITNTENVHGGRMQESCAQMRHNMKQKDAYVNRIDIIFSTSAEPISTSKSHMWSIRMFCVHKELGGILRHRKNTKSATIESP